MLQNLTKIERINLIDMISKISLALKKGIKPQKVFCSKKRNLSLRKRIKIKQQEITTTPSKGENINMPHTGPHEKPRCYLKHSPSKQAQLRLSLLFSNITLFNKLPSQSRKKALSVERTNKQSQQSFDSVGQTNDINNKQMRYSQIKITKGNYLFEDSNSYYANSNNRKEINSNQKKVTFSISPTKINKSFSYYQYQTVEELIQRPMTTVPQLRNKNRQDDTIGKLVNSYNKRISSIDGFTHIGQYQSNDININQDAYSIANHFHPGYEPNETFCALVCDGHGVNGHLVSNYIAKRLSSELRYQINKNPNAIADYYERTSAISTAYNEMNEKLKTITEIDLTLSGSTCCAVIATPKSLICSNIGNSRAVIGSFKDNKWSAYELSRDHKPDLYSEKQRIRSNGGQIQSSIDDQSLRVSKKDDDIPGLNITRAFGDLIGSEIGIISVPEIKEYQLSFYDKYFIIASDGIWDVISSQESIEMISEFYLINDIKGAISSVFKIAQNKWRQGNSNNDIDDITIILAFFE